MVPLLLAFLLMGEPSVRLSAEAVCSKPSLDRREGSVTLSRTYRASLDVLDPAEGAGEELKGEASSVPTDISIGARRID